MIITRLTPSPIAALFKARREELELTQQEVADRVTELLPAREKLTQQSYAAFERGKSQTSKHAMQIANVLKIPLERLTAISIGEVSSAQEPRASYGPTEPSAIFLGAISTWDDSTPLDDDEIEVPLLKEVELSAGSGRISIQEHSKAKLRFGSISLRRQGIEPANAVCVSVYGNSMEPVLPHGSTAGVDRGRTTIKDGDIYALSHNGHLRVKLLYRLPTGGLRLRSFNRDEHPDEEYTPEQIRDQDLTIIGRVFWYSVLR
ncbi:MAG: helix-turn-helix domain-containing protein [Gammaproteobacteria bacterium]|uniref:Putative peptidase n=1 Tax=viral metagenome TaxID=1070528 RepID=A0A6M3XH89_9ZZZZ|nr:helix-turn-helix domain-containing protein [Gammaproteobacteria bacterium]MBU2067495.1 helix-turn-helix domain-containing protein [Gammaproteobacteria bacterium]MBU2139505.1 helix-turn-helix domain-containing protein [Gammaproteobacteria bacterium]MBU2255932.1 helix-turn-helix domain-containing protein [Gammaproteobacteria bacterium]MBU2295577.1 helix-turn-helix domain-containing protein [Gammaproteobacteria bacterium]